ncbi:uncharacterized protein LOC124480701 isoform X1 [Hypomesus transpacificus]|uniref:uncharacterized protein LOC124480701 isoform X1 n=1 Tax=Hypomesus transpacificus TaxID=137520 RepID=UPI001F071A8B|nr:uncharacterized protein LOC124480701 isoform X1 [Hypomesus transpacificus]
MAKTSQIPDKRLWKRYKIRIISSTDNYKTARKRAMKATESSNVESEEEEKRRKRSVPSRYRTVSENNTHIDSQAQTTVNAGASMTIQPHEAIERPCRTVQELSELQLKLESLQQQKIMTKFLKLMGGSSIGDAVRRILRKVATNETWSNYSLKGRKGKLPFMGTTLYKIVLRACDEQFPRVSEKEIEAWIGDTLKHAPHRAKVVGPNNCTRRRIWGTRRI